jgi:hypothetical protein
MSRNESCFHEHSTGVLFYTLFISTTLPNDMGGHKSKEGKVKKLAVRLNEMKTHQYVVMHNS